MVCTLILTGKITYYNNLSNYKVKVTCRCDASAKCDDTVY